MSNKEKWKTQPCKECIIKNICKKECFKWPFSTIIYKYVTDNNLRCICLNCGIKISYDKYWCIKCGYREVIE